jgi:hypothetical protein
MIVQNKKDLRDQQQDQDVAQPAARALFMTFGKIEEVDEEARLIKVRDLNTNEIIGGNKGWLRILGGWEDIMHRFGTIMPGFWVRVWWRGTHVSRNPIAEVIGDEGIDFFKSRPHNKGEVGVHKILSPGV